MSQTVEPPILPESSPDRQVNCEVAVEAAFKMLVAASEAQGWTAQEAAAALLKVAAEHAQQLDLVVAAAEPGIEVRAASKTTTSASATSSKRSTNSKRRRRAFTTSAM